MSLRRSPQGFTRCVDCRAHIVAGARPADTNCPFCGANLVAGGGQRRVAGRGDVLRVSLLALTLGGGCSLAHAPEEDAGAEVVDAGVDDAGWGEDAGVPVVTARYGLPPDE